MTGHFKIVFSDIDGTLLDSQNRVPVKTREAILELEQRGIPFVLISARSPEAVSYTHLTWEPRFGPWRNKMGNVHNTNGMICKRSGDVRYG